MRTSGRSRRPLRRGMLLGALLWLLTVSSAGAVTPPTWLGAAALPNARYGHTATLLKSGKVLVVGGVASDEPNFASAATTVDAELYDPATNTWASAAPLHDPHHFQTATLLQSGKVLVTGGDDDAGLTGDAELYDPLANTWKTISPLPIPRAADTATLLASGKVLVTGGFATNTPPYVTADSELYDPATNTWASAAPLPVPRSDQTATLLPSGKVLVTGGDTTFAAPEYTNDTELYDPSTNAWTQGPTLPGPSIGRGDATATLLQSGNVLITGGAYYDRYGHLAALDDSERYNPTTNTWSSAAALPVPRVGQQATLLQSGDVLVTSGYTSFVGACNGTQDVELYHSATDSWSNQASLPVVRVGETATLLSSGEVLVTGGELNGPSDCEHGTGDSELFTSGSSSHVGPTRLQQGAGPNASELPTTCNNGDPVNCATGTFWRTFTDASIPGLGVPLGFTRTYSASTAASTGPLGYGWTDSYNLSLTFDGSGSATVSQEDGAAVVFSATGSSYTPGVGVLASLVKNASGTFTFTRDATNVQYVFDSSGKLIHEIDRNGHSTDLAYSDGLLSTVTDQAGRTLTLGYSGSHLASLTDPLGNKTTYAYDSAGNLTSTTDPLGRTWHFTYDANHLLLSIADPRGGVTTNTYDTSSRVVKQVDPLGRPTSWAYSGDPTSATGSTTTITDPRGIVSTYNYANLELLSLTHGVGTSAAATASYQYDPVTLGRTSSADPDGHVTIDTYDARGDVTSTTDPFGRTTKYRYDAEGDLLGSTDPLGTTTSYAYDADGNLLSKATPLTGTTQVATTSYSYGSGATAGEALSTTDPDGNVTSYGYDSAGDQTSVTSPTGDKTVATYDEDGRLLSTTTPLGNVTSHVYDADGELVKTTDPLGKVTTYAYDAGGDKTGVTDANGHTTTYVLDLDGEQTSVVQPDGTSSKASYDADGNVLTQMDGNGHAMTDIYDALNRIASSTDPLGRKTTYGYDDAGNEILAVDPPGRTTSYSYDADNRLTITTYSDGTTPDVQQSYDADGRRIALKDGTGTSSFVYDSLGRLTKQTNGAGARTSYGYDLDGNVTSTVYPSGKTVTAAYDADDRMRSVTDWLGNVVTFRYDHDGNLTTETLPGYLIAQDVLVGLSCGHPRADEMGDH